MIQYIKTNSYETTYFDEEWIVLNTDNYTLTRLNETGGFCWSLLSKPQSIETLSKAVINEFDQPSEGVQEDMKAFIKDLFKCGLIQHVI